MKKKKLLSAVTASVIVISSVPFSVHAEDTADVVTLFTTNDIHGVVGGDESTIGLALASAIAESTPDSLLIDAGDATQGAAFATISQGEDVIAAMNAAGYDVMAAGNHEFDYGAEQLLKNAELADFPILSANVTKDGKPLLDDNTVIEVGDHRIGFVGITTVQTASSTNPSKLENISFNDEIQTAKAEISELADETDGIVIIGHLGDNDAAVPCTSNQLLDALTDDEFAEVVAVIDGHSHTVEQVSYERSGRSVPIVQTGTRFTGLGKIEITFDGENVSASAEVMDIQKALDYKLTDEGTAKLNEVNSAISEIQNAQNDVLGEVLCENTSPLWGGYIYFDYAEPRICETNYGDFVTDAFVRYGKEYAKNQDITSPVVAFENGGGISSALPAGTVTKGDILNAFNHGNTVVALKVTPADIYNALEVGLTMSGQDPETGMLIREKVSGSFMQVGGMSYSYSPSGSSGSKVQEVKLADGTVLDRADTSTEILLITNEYVASGFSADLKCGELGGEDYLIESYIIEQTENGSKALDMPVSGGRITIADDVSPEFYTAAIPVYDSATLGTTAGQTIDSENSVVLKNRIVHISIDGEPSEEFVTDENGCINLTLTKGAHVISLDESSDGLPVYLNNYSGSGLEYTKEGYYRLGFSAADLPEYVPDDPTESDDPAESEDTDISQTSSETPASSTTSSTTTSTASDSTTTSSTAASTTTASTQKGEPNKTTDNPNTGAALPSAVMLVTVVGAILAVRKKNK